MFAFQHPGLARILEIIADPSVSDVLINSPTLWFADYGNGVQPVPTPGLESSELSELAVEIIALADRHLDLANPMCDVGLTAKELAPLEKLGVSRLRVHAVLESAVSTHTRISIRVHREHQPSLEQLMQSGFCTRDELDELKSLLSQRANLVISGPSGAGKTTLLRALLAESPQIRTILVEDTAELMPVSGHVVGLQMRQSNIEGRGEVGLDALLRQALRMRPDRLVIGEVRGGELVTLLQALNTGHRGSLFTIHANSADEVLTRMLGIWLGLGQSAEQFRILANACLDSVVHLERVGSNRKILKLGRLK